jgi:eukaryotic-like serine/threonine-protein kinase
MLHHDIAPGYVIADKYRVVLQLGEGGMGQVYQVQHVKTEERFALKILNPSVAKTASARERFRREARTPARIDSDHVCRVVDTDIATDLDGAPFLVMEYLRGQNLQELSDELGPLPPKEVLVYLRQIALALDKAHAIGIVHRDLKPENLFLTTRDDGNPCLKILDFGIAKLSGATGDLAHVKATQTGDVFGTPLYMSPEQCKSESEKVCGQSDVWALGLIAHRLLTGDDFWTANTLTHLIAQIAYEPMPKASDRGAAFGDAYEAWFARCCAREVSERFATAGDAVRALQEAFGLGAEASGVISQELVATELARTASARASTSSPGKTGPLHQTSEALTLDPIHPRNARRRPTALIALVAAILLSSAGVGIYFVSRARPAEHTAADPAPLAGSSPIGAPVASAPAVPPVAAAPPIRASAEPEPAVPASAPATTPKPTPRKTQPAPTPPPAPIEPKKPGPLDTRT